MDEQRGSREAHRRCYSQHQGYLLTISLFLASFLAATILPFSSEAVLIAALSAGAPKYEALIAASLGNMLAVVVNYFLGFFLYEKTKTKLLHSRTGKKALHWGHKWGYGALLLSWLPIIGDPLTIVAGLVRLKFWIFLLIAGSLRVGRYYLIMVGML